MKSERHAARTALSCSVLGFDASFAAGADGDVTFAGVVVCGFLADTAGAMGSDSAG
jgi:hypothetical protein